MDISIWWSTTQQQKKLQPLIHTTWMDRKNIMLTGRSQSRKITYLLYDCSYMTFLKWQNCGDGHRLVVAKGQRWREERNIQQLRRIQENSLWWSKIQGCILTVVVITLIYKWDQTVLNYTHTDTHANAQIQMNACKNWWKLNQVCLMNTIKPTTMSWF